MASASVLIWAERALWVGVAEVCVQVSCVFVHVHVSPSQTKVENPTATVCWERASVLKKAIDAVDACSRNIAVVTASLDIKKQNDPLLECKFKELAKLHEALNTQVKAACKLHVMDAAPEEQKNCLGRSTQPSIYSGITAQAGSTPGNVSTRTSRSVNSFSQTSFSCR